MKQDFYTYDPVGIYEIKLELPGDDDIQAIIKDAQGLESFLRVKVQEQGKESKRNSIWFVVTVFLTDLKDVTWMKLKWA